MHMELGDFVRVENSNTNKTQKIQLIKKDTIMPHKFVITPCIYLCALKYFKYYMNKNISICSKNFNNQNIIR
jgi:hypothetical protein